MKISSTEFFNLGVMNLSCPHCEFSFEYKSKSNQASDILISCPKCSKEFQISIVKEEVAPTHLGQNRTCPFCDEIIPTEVIRCKFCGKYQKKAKVTIKKVRDDESKSILIDWIKRHAKLNHSESEKFCENLPKSFLIDYPSAIKLEISFRNKGVILKVEDGDLIPASKVKKKTAQKQFEKSFSETVFPKISFENVLKSMHEKTSIFNEFFGKYFVQRKDLISIGIIVLIPFFSLGLDESIQILFFPLFLGVLWSHIIFSFFGDGNVPLSYAIKYFLFTATVSVFLVLIISGILSCINFLPKLSRSFLQVGMVEEFCKIIPIILLIKKSKEKRIALRFLDILVLSMICGVGFAANENIGYKTMIDFKIGLAWHYKPELVAEMSNIFILRLISLPFLHAAWSGILGVICFYGFTVGKLRKCLIGGLLAVAFIHAMYNFAGGITSIVLVVLSIILVIATHSFCLTIDKMKVSEITNSAQQ